MSAIEWPLELNPTPNTRWWGSLVRKGQSDRHPPPGGRGQMPQDSTAQSGEWHGVALCCLMMFHTPKGMWSVGCRPPLGDRSALRCTMREADYKATFGMPPAEYLL